MKNVLVIRNTNRHTSIFHVSNVSFPMQEVGVKLNALKVLVRRLSLRLSQEAMYLHRTQGSLAWEPRTGVKVS